MADQGTDVVTGGATDEPEASLQKDAGEVVTRWLRELQASTTHEKDWRERAEKIVKLYKDEKEKAEHNPSYRYNILFANTEVTKGALYSQCPTPDIRRRHLTKDDVSRTAATILTRAVATAMDLQDFDGAMKECVADMALPGRGVGWVKYNPTIVDGEVTNEAVELCYVEWEFFRYSPAKRWKRVRWVAFGELLTKDDLLKQFPDCAEEVELKWMPKGTEDTEENAILKRALVWTIYNKPDRKVYVVCDGYKERPLKVSPDPLNLEHFFPTPDPLYAIRTTDSLVPVPEYAVYQDHALQLDEINERIAVLTQALRRRGVYDASVPELEDLANSGDNQFVPVKDYRAFVEKGGLENAFQEADISNLAKVLVQLMEQAESKKAQIYEIIGISDIMRGTTEAQETLGAQQLKNQWGSIRIGPKQRDVQRFARDAVRLMAEVIAEHFSAQTLAAMTGVELFMTPEEKAQAQIAAQPQPGMPPPPQDPRLNQPTWAEVMQVLRSDKLRGFKVDIETDSTIQPNAMEEQKNRTEAITALTGFFKEVLPAVQTGAVPQKVAMELANFGLRAFKTGPQLEELLDQWSEQSGNEDPNVARLTAENEQLKQAADGNQLERDKMGFEREKLGMERDRMTEDHAFQRDQMMAKQAEATASRDVEVSRVAEQSIPAVTAMAQAIAQQGQILAVLAEGLQALGGGQEQLAQAVVQMGQQISQAVASELSRPKRRELIRGKDGRAVAAIETTMSVQ